MPSDVLLDLGCGAGRVICGAARTPAATVVGIDIDPRMVELARANAGSLRGRRCEVVVEHADATTFAVPDESTVIFLYNPFDGDVLRAAMARVVESIDRVPRTVRVVYANPKEPEVILATRRFVEVSQISLGWRPGRAWKQFQLVHVYSTSPTSSRS